MAEAKQTKQAKLTAESARNMKPEERAKSLDEKQTELREARASMAARELTNPRKITQLRREIAVIKTVDNEIAIENEETT